MGRPVGAAISHLFDKAHWGAWRERAACLGEDNDLWFDADDYQKVKQAIAICQTCPVKTDCLEYAVETKPKYGIFGGLRPAQIRRVIRERHSETQRLDNPVEPGSVAV